MQRDMDLIRKIALETSHLEYGHALTGVDGATPEEFGVHAMWMQEAGLIKATIQEFTSRSAPKVLIHRLTWSGCEFVDAIRDETVWSKAKTEVIKPGMSFTFDVLKDWLKTEITQGLPTLRAMAQ